MAAASSSAAASASRRLRELQSRPGNRTCVDCAQRNPQWASVSLGAFLCLECSGKHRGLGVHISFVRSVTMDSWSEPQLRKMEVGGNDPLNAFLTRHGIPKETHATAKYNSRAAAVYRDRIQALADGRPWQDPPIIEENPKFGPKKPPLVQGSGKNAGIGDNGGWDSWDTDGFHPSAGPDMRRHQSVGDLRAVGGGKQPSRSRSTDDIHTRAQLEASAGSKESFFARKMAENESRPEGIPPSQGGKYVGFGSDPPPSRSSSQGDLFSVVSQGFGQLSLVAASAAQSAANVVQAGTKELTSKVREGSYDTRMNETVNVVTTKTTEMGQKTWGIMKGVMALASQKVEEFAKDGSRWGDDWEQNENNPNRHLKEFGQGYGGSNAAAGHPSGSSSWEWDSHDSNKGNGKGIGSGRGSWDDWDSHGSKKGHGKGAGSAGSYWDDWGLHDNKKGHGKAGGSGGGSWDDWGSHESRKELGKGATNGTGPWDGWDVHDRKKGDGQGATTGESWAGWDNEKDDGCEGYNHNSSNKNFNGGGNFSST